MLHRSGSLKSQANSADKKLNKMTPGDGYFQQQADVVRNLREQIRILDAEIMDEKPRLSDWKRVKAREWMNVLFDGLFKCNATGAFVALSGREIVEYVPTETTQPGRPESRYSGHFRVEHIVAEAERRLHEISSGVPLSGAPGNRPSTPSSPVQPTPTQRTQPSSTHPTNSSGLVSCAYYLYIPL